MEELDKQTGLPELQRVHTVIENISGRLEVDKHTNKSGKIPVKRWPVFTSYENSYAYYDKQSPYPLELNDQPSRFLSSHARSHAYHKHSPRLIPALFLGTKPPTRKIPSPTML